ncbi:hypothetical protein BC829DRAFT_409642 [Chytridium lagenaria]|nr:hypothetical protein BC829DRAFT_409642 [Chytridium lagenaria]
MHLHPALHARNQSDIKNHQSSMDKLYGAISSPSSGKPLPLPIKDSLKKRKTHTDEKTLSTIHELLNHEIRAGNSYPFEHEMDRQGFLNYFLSHHAFVVTDDESGETLGCFYIKPNFPGRCSHICNGGFLTMLDHRNKGKFTQLKQRPDPTKKGVGKVMAKAFVILAPAVGYRASMFNLVFERNVGSAMLWRGLGFREIGRLPKGARVKQEDGTEAFEDVIMFHYDFTEDASHLVQQ